MQSNRDSNSKRPQVALLVHTQNEWIRQVLRGVAGYAHEHAEWDFYLEATGLDQPVRVPANLRPTGIITRITDAKWEEKMRKMGVPVVNVSWRGSHSPEIPKVVSDPSACAHMSAQHFIDRGFRSFGYVGPINRPAYDDPLMEPFQAIILEREFEHSILCPTEHLEASLFEQRNALRKWVKSLPKPVAVLVWSSDIAREVTAICSEEQIDIPAELAVLCVEYDSVMSSLAPTPISNIDQAGTRVGYEAARLLHSLMEGGPAPAAPVVIDPVGIVQRQSTDTTAVADELVAAAAQFIASNLGRPITVRHICEALNVSRRNLETRFFAALGRTPAAEIRRARLEHVKRLLVETDLPLRVIAKQSGFNHTEVMIRNFSKQLGESPGQFRRSH